MAIVMVVMAHSYCLLQRLAHAAYIGRAVNLLERSVINLGPVGVELFFVLSGFLIGGILIKLFQSTDFTFATVRGFWIRRWFRTLPNYWLILTLNIILFRFVKGNTLDPENYIGYFFLQNLVHPNILNLFPEGWSLSVEEWFYLTLPVVMYLSSLIFRPADKGRFLLRVFMGYLCFFLLVRVANAFHPLNGNDPDEGIRKVVLFRLDAVMYGVLFAWFSFYYKAALDRIKKPLFIFSVLGSVVLYYFIVKYELAFTPQPNHTFRFFTNAFLYMVIPVVFSCCLPYASGVKEFRNKYLAGAVRHISTVSYSIYLVHFSLFAMWFYNFKVSSVWMGIAQYVLYWAVVIGTSSLLYRFFELPVMKLRDKWSK